jgi:hypothetical protein
MDTAVSIESIVFVRYKQLKGGKKIARSIRIINSGIKTTTTGEGSEKLLLVTVDNKFAAGTLMGTLNTKAGTLIMASEGLKPLGYLKNKYFQVAGYMPHARMSNTNRRKKGLDLGSKVSTPRTPHVSGGKRSKF